MVFWGGSGEQNSAPTVERVVAMQGDGALRVAGVGLLREPLTPLTAQRLRRVVGAAGFAGAAKRTAWALAMRESRGIPDIVSPINSNGTRDNGLFQINDVHQTNHDFAQILTAKGNAQIAYLLSQNGTDFGAWGVGRTGWAEHLYQTQPKFWLYLQNELKVWRAQYPKRVPVSYS